jgi:hypothetical protein
MLLVDEFKERLVFELGSFEKHIFLHLKDYQHHYQIFLHRKASNGRDKRCEAAKILCSRNIKDTEPAISRTRNVNILG